MDLINYLLCVGLQQMLSSHIGGKTVDYNNMLNSNESKDTITGAMNSKATLVEAAGLKFKLWWARDEEEEDCFPPCRWRKAVSVKRMFFAFETELDDSYLAEQKVMDYLRSWVIWGRDWTSSQMSKTFTWSQSPSRKISPLCSHPGNTPERLFQADKSRPQSKWITVHAVLLTWWPLKVQSHQSNLMKTSLIVW